MQMHFTLLLCLTIKLEVKCSLYEFYLKINYSFDILDEKIQVFEN